MHSSICFGLLAFAHPGIGLLLAYIPLYLQGMLEEGVILSLYCFACIAAGQSPHSLPVIPSLEVTQAVGGRSDLFTRTVFVLRGSAFVVGTGRSLCFSSMDASESG